MTTGYPDLNKTGETKYLQKKIKESIKEFEEGKPMRNGQYIKSKEQAIAIAYAKAKKVKKLKK